MAMTVENVRTRATLETILKQVSNLMEAGGAMAQDADRLADEICGSTPEAVSDAPMDGPRSGKLEQLSQFLELATTFQDNTRQSLRRLERVLIVTPAIETGRVEKERY